jgi:hypothetical protein
MVETIVYYDQLCKFAKDPVRVCWGILQDIAECARGYYKNCLENFQEVAF